MAGWIKLAVRSFAVAALVGAAQLGAAQALALLTWGTVPPPDLWRRELMWLLFIFAAAVLGGVAGGRRSVRAIRLAIASRRAIAAAQRHSGLTMHQSGMRAARRRAVAAAKDKTVDKARGFAAGATRVSATLFAALGAATSFALVWLSARNAFGAADLTTLARTAGVGIAVGSVISLLSLAASPIAANAGMTIIWIWVFGLTSIGLAIATGRPTQTPRLGVLDAPYLIGPDEWWLGPNLMVAVAAAVGLAVAAAARWIGAHRLAVAMSGLAGPTLLAAGYLLVGPGAESTGGYVASLLAATVGLLTSAATAAAHRGSSQTATMASGPAAIAAGPASTGLPGVAAQPLAIESGRPSAPGQANPGYGAPQPLYLAPARSAPVRPPRVTPPVPPARTATAAAAGPAGGLAATARRGARAKAPDPSATWPGGLPGPYSAPPVPAPPRATTGSKSRRAAPAPRPTPPPAVQSSSPAATPVAATSAPTAAPVPAARPAAAAAPPQPAATAQAPTASVPSATASSAATAGSASPTRPAPVTSPPKADPGAQVAPKASAKPAKPARTKRGRNTVEPQPVVAAAPVVAAEPVPRTAKPAQVVAVELSTPSPAAEPTVQRTSRRAKRRAAREAERVAAEQAAIAAREARRDRRAPALDKREREHVDWVKHLVSLPNDPTLTSREK